jgi:phospholipid/cholesterol/gamma-HCH transport system substrate-binding protein
VITVRQLVSGLSKDRNTIGEAVDSIGDLTDSTADLLKDARPPLKDDIRYLGELSSNLNDNQDLVERFLTTLPRKMDVLTPLGTYGSWFNFYLCDFTGRLTLPGGIQVPISLPPGVIVGADKRCTAAGLPNNFGIHDDKSKKADPLVTIPGLGGG